MRLGCRSSKAMANIVVLGSTPMSTRAQLAPPSVVRNRAPRSLWKFAPAATQMVFGSPGASRMSRQYVCPLAFSASRRALTQCSPWSLLRNRPARPIAVPAAPAGCSVRGRGRDGLGTGARVWGRDGAESVDIDYARGERVRRLDGKPLLADPRAHRAAHVAPHASTRATE
jgi:hypothetical protein